MSCFYFSQCQKIIFIYCTSNMFHIFWVLTMECQPGQWSLYTKDDKNTKSVLTRINLKPQLYKSYQWFKNKNGQVYGKFLFTYFDKHIRPLWNTSHTSLDVLQLCVAIDWTAAWWGQTWEFPLFISGISIQIYPLMTSRNSIGY